MLRGNKCYLFVNKCVTQIFPAILVLVVVNHFVLAGDDKTANVTQNRKSDTTNITATCSPFIFETQQEYLADKRRKGGAVFDALHGMVPWNKLAEQLKENKPADEVTLYYCILPTIDAVKIFVPVVDTFVLWPFNAKCGCGPAEDESIWPNYDNPLINQLRELRQVTKEKTLIASFPNIPHKIYGFPKDRGISAEEMEWMYFALMGARFNGILWDCPLEKHPHGKLLRNLQNSCKGYLKNITNAQSVSWVKAPPGQPVTAFCSNGKLFVIFVNPEYMNYNIEGKIILPLKSKTQQGELIIAPPENYEFKAAAKYLSNRPIDLIKQDAKFLLKYNYRGGGEIIIIEISKKSCEK